jgi:hypothetical protein
MKTCKLFLFILILFTSINNSYSQGYLKVDGKRIVNEEGENIILRGMGLGGWMLQEGYMLKINKAAMQHAIKARIADLIGEEGCNKFYDMWLENHVRKADVDSLARWGFNSIRLPVHYNLFTLPVEKEPVKGKQTWLEKGFKMTDSLLAWCKENKIYLILDLHAAPGGQGKDANISDYDSTKASLWESDENKEKTIVLWGKLAERYAGEKYIGGYDLINEPNWTFEGKDRHGREDINNSDIWDLYKRITASIREHDKNHIIFIEGNGWGNNFRGFPGSWDNNMALSFHKYWNPNNQDDISFAIELREKFNMPLWLGESGENSNKWFTDCISLMEKNNIGWAWWPLKKIGNYVCPFYIKVPDGYDDIVNYWNNGTERPSKEKSAKALFEAAENLKSENCRFNKDIIDAMFRQVNDKTNKPFTENKIPGRIYAVDFDLGYPGEAYSDSDNERTGEPGKNGGNRGRLYRNDGADIEACKDDPEHTNGFNVNYIEDNEWLRYTVSADTEGEYLLTARIASDSAQGNIKVELDGKESATAVIPVTGGNQQWKNIEPGKIYLSKGLHDIKLIFTKGGFNLNYFEISPVK